MSLMALEEDRHKGVACIQTGQVLHEGIGLAVISSLLARIYAGIPAVEHLSQIIHPVQFITVEP